jgi:hypothetical protein
MLGELAAMAVVLTIAAHYITD